MLSSLLCLLDFEVSTATDFFGLISEFMTLFRRVEFFYLDVWMMQVIAGGCVS